MKNDRVLIENVLRRGVENVIPSAEKLEKLLTSGKALNVYLGIDPTATRIHLGHAVPLRRLKWLVELGHKVTFLIGDFTALIGDTSDKDGERPVLTHEQIKENFETYKQQAEKILDFSKIEVRFNSEWLSKLGFDDVVKLTRHFSLNDFISRELIKKRLVEGRSVSLPEVLYPVMQGYDSYFLDTDVQIGGTDQTFNMQAGRTLQKDLRNKESFIVANGFLSGTDGRKMSKSWGNGIWLTDSAEEIFGKVMSITDQVIEEYFNLATNLDLDEIEKIIAPLKNGENPMKVKMVLARQIVRELCGDGEVEKAEKHFDNSVVNKTPEDVAEMKVRFEKIGSDQLAGLLVGGGLVASKSEFRRLMEQGGVYIDEKRLEDKKDIVIGKGVTVRVGKRRYVRLVKS